MFTAPPLGTTMRRAGSVRGELYPVIHYLTYLSTHPLYLPPTWTYKKMRCVSMCTS